MTSRPVEDVLRSSPFSGSSLPPTELQQQSELFLSMFNLACSTQDEHEEIWAYGNMKAAFAELMGHPPLDPAHNLPAGMWEAMNWAAELRVTGMRS